MAGPGWHRRLLILGLVCGVAGGAVLLVGHLALLPRVVELRAARAAGDQKAGAPPTAAPARVKPCPRCKECQPCKKCDPCPALTGPEPAAVPDAAAPKLAAAPDSGAKAAVVASGQPEAKTGRPATCPPCPEVAPKPALKPTPAAQPAAAAPPAAGAGALPLALDAARLSALARRLAGVAKPDFSLVFPKNRGYLDRKLRRKVAGFYNRQLTKHPLVLVVGRTHPRRDTVKNPHLALRRSLSLGAFLVDLGLPAQRLLGTVTLEGEDAPGRSGPLADAYLVDPAALGANGDSAGGER